MPSPRKRITVTQKNIDQGVPENSSKCMVAEAVKCTIEGAKKVHVDMQTIRYTDEQGIRRVWLTPPAVQTALVRFDAGDPVEPFAFKLPDPIHVNKPTHQKISSKAREKVESRRAMRVGPRVGGRSVPVISATTRRKFGIRHLRINQEGKVVQLGTETVVPQEA